MVRFFYAMNLTDYLVVRMGRATRDRVAQVVLQEEVMLQELIRPRQRPVTNVVAVFIIAMTFIPIVAAYWLTQRGDDDARR